MITKVNDWLYRGPRPDNMDELKALGIGQIINLEVGWFETFNGKWEQEQKQAASAYIPYVHLPISDWEFPTNAEFKAILTWINNSTECELNRRVKTYVHCLHGMDRTGIVIAAFRVSFDGMPLDKAIQEMYDMGYHKFPYEFPLGWTAALRSYLK